MYTYVCIHIYIYTYMYVCICICIICIDACIYAYLTLHICIRLFIYLPVSFLRLLLCLISIVAVVCTFCLFARARFPFFCGWGGGGWVSARLFDVVWRFSGFWTSGLINTCRDSAE